MFENFYELNPGTIQRSFYGKALVRENDDGSRTLFSYLTPIMTKTDKGYVKHWEGWSATTGRHIHAFSGMLKKEYDKLEYKEFIG